MAYAAGLTARSTRKRGSSRHWGVVGEAARVLEPGGALCASIVHPLRSRERARSYLPPSA